MEKLIKLLSEYDKLLPWWRLVYNPEYKCFYCHIKWDALVSNRYHVGEVISKDFWFIKRLVDSDKIDEKRVFHFLDNSELYEDVLCNLALSDEPISFLISILK